MNEISGDICRDRVLRAIRFQYPDRVPVSYAIGGTGLLTYGRKIIELCCRYPGDFYDPAEVLKIPARDTAHYQPDGTYFKRETDAWGCVWEFLQEGISGEVKESPLADWAALDTYIFPPVPDATPEDREQRKTQMAKIKQRYPGWASVDSLFERMQYLRGVENLLIDLADGAPEVEILADRMLEEWLIPRAMLAVETGADIVAISDDWGAQHQALINPATWRAVFKPRYRRLFEVIHEGGAFAWLHSCGMMLELVPEFIEIGLDVLNPQINCYDWDVLRDVTHRRMTLAPGIGQQGLLEFGTPNEVREYIRRVKTFFGDPAGGLILLTGAEGFMPWANIEALFPTLFDSEAEPGGACP
jgi:hypothetical protein